ncbi:hypothetical protein Tco_0589157 [Tanacetum coccineum]
MNVPNITMEEYIQLEAEKDRRRGQEFNWETATYGKVRYFEDIDYFKKFEAEFPATVYKDALTSEPEVSSEPTVPSCVPNGHGTSMTWWERKCPYCKEGIYPSLSPAMKMKRRIEKMETTPASCDLLLKDIVLTYFHDDSQKQGLEIMSFTSTSRLFAHEDLPQQA